MDQNDKMEKFKTFIDKLSNDEKKEFKRMKNSYKVSIGSDIILNDILNNIDTIDFVNRNVPYERDTECYKCNTELNEKKYFICATCGWFICKCGACGCSKVKKIRFSKFTPHITDFSRKNSANILSQLKLLTLPLQKNDFNNIFKGTAIIWYKKSDNVLYYINNKLHKFSNLESDNTLDLEFLLK
jgi:hypothetical protein